jgi:hypothetical protein
VTQGKHVSYVLLKVTWHANCLFLHSLSCQIKNSHERPISLSLVSDTVLRTAPLQQAEPPSRKFYDCGDSGYIAPCLGSIFSPLVPAGCPSAEVIPVPSGLSRQTAFRARFVRCLDSTNYRVDLRAPHSLSDEN